MARRFEPSLRKLLLHIGLFDFQIGILRSVAQLGCTLLLDGHVVRTFEDANEPHSSVQTLYRGQLAPRWVLALEEV